MTREREKESSSSSAASSSSSSRAIAIVQYSAEYPGAPWDDQCVPDPKKEAMSVPPDTRPYCKTMAKLVRLKVSSNRSLGHPRIMHLIQHPFPPSTQVDEDLSMAELDTELMQDWCTSTYTHHVGTITFLADGSMLYGAGDGSHFQGLGKLTH